MKPVSAALAACATVITLAASAALAAGPMDGAIKARQGLMDNLAFNLGVLGGMAKGAMPYDQSAAQAAAGNIVTLTTLNEGAYWPKGSDNGAVEGTHALPAIWDKPDAFMGHMKDLHDAAVKMQEAAGTDLSAVQGAMKGVGGACGGCHKQFRAPSN
ncbi:c-type cytochrome [Acidimangrovimonas sediminis]|uniref:c-type cytochrome n=1 Tax=Acidimangrovimonas sediminis TaxID=2056283 RepID=UPI000C7F9ED1|nr:cytochrome c [Acidimangrovimonas sediminis]